MAVINQYSFAWLSLGGVVILTILLAARRAPARHWLALAALSAGLVAAFLFLQPTAPSPDAAIRLEASIRAGTPVLVELQSPY